MKKTDIVLSLELLADRGACEQGLYDFEKWYPSDSAPLSEVLRKIQELAYTNIEYVDYAIWLFDTFPPTQEPLVLNELTDKIIIHNGNLTIKKGVKGERVIIVNGDLNIEGGANLNGRTKIYAKNVIAKNKAIALYDWVEIFADKVKGHDITLYKYTEIFARVVNGKKITLYDYAKIWVEKEIKAEQANAYDWAEMLREENGRFVEYTPILTNPENTNTAS